MCGIVGIFLADAALAVAGITSQMCDRLRHRGPDDFGVWSSGGCDHGVVRLAIIDVAGGKQPIVNEDASVALACNGEIYNHRELRVELERQGHVFRTRTDVEVILHLWEQIGESAFARLNGMFACALYDTRKQRFVVARDRFGQKPLYIWRRPGEVVIASEAKALLAHPDFAVRIDPNALASYLTLRYVPGPLSIFAGVEKLPPGSFRVWSADGRERLERYWQVDFTRTEALEWRSDLPERLWGELREAVARHLMSERPVGVFLSGGLDSACLVACLRELGWQKLPTFTVGFSGFEGSELAEARAIAGRFDTEHHEVELVPEGFWSALDEIVYDLDEPNAATPAPALRELARLASARVTVVLSGEGADELLAGYRGFDRRHARAVARGMVGKIPGLASRIRRARGKGRIGRTLRALGGEGSNRREVFSMSRVFDEEELSQHCIAPEVRNARPALDALRSYYEARSAWSDVDQLLGGMIEWWLPDNLLALADRMTMARSLELRCPFLDGELASFCERLPLQARAGLPWSKFPRKRALKLAAARRLGRAYVGAPKRGFITPALRWLVGPLAREAGREIARSNSLAAHVFEPGYRSALWDQARAGDPGAQEKCWSLIVLNKWGDQWTS